MQFHKLHHDMQFHIPTQGWIITVPLQHTKQNFIII